MHLATQTSSLPWFAFSAARGILALLFIVLALRFWHLLLTPVQFWLWRLPTILDFQASHHTFALGIARQGIAIFLRHRIIRTTAVSRLGVLPEWGMAACVKVARVAAADALMAGAFILI